MEQKIVQHPDGLAGMYIDHPVLDIEPVIEKDRNGQEQTDDRVKLPVEVNLKMTFEKLPDLFQREYAFMISAAIAFGENLSM